MDLPRIGALIALRLAVAALAAPLSACAAPAPGPAPAPSGQGEAYFAGIDDLPLAPGLVERP
ncbi:MAG: hypothetical protein ACO3EK_11860, partial [Alphaproteobacteria bacterium]